MIETSNKPQEFHQHFLYSIKIAYVISTTKKHKTPLAQLKEKLDSPLQRETGSILLTAAV